MNGMTHSHRHDEGQTHEGEHRRGPHWRHIHRHWYFWVGLSLMLIAMGTYVMTEDLSWRPRGHQATAVLKR